MKSAHRTKKEILQSRTYTENDVAAILGIVRATIYTLANSGLFKTIRISSNVGYPESIGLTLFKGPLQQVRIFVHTLFELRICSSPPDLCEQIGLAHDAQKCL